MSSDDSALRTRMADICRDLPQVTITRHFHATNFTVAGKVFAFIKQEAVVIKLPAARARALVASGQATPLVMGKRVMREWIVLGCTPGQASTMDAAHVHVAIAYVSGTEQERV